MKKITLDFGKPVNVNLLTEELFAAFPGWGIDAGGTCHVSIGRDYVKFPEGSAEVEAVKAVIEAHSPAGESFNQKRDREEKQAKEARKQKVRDARSVNELRDVLLEILESENVDLRRG